MTELTRDQQLLEEFKEGLDKDGPVVLAQRVAELEAENKRLSDELELNEEDGASSDNEIIRLTKERDAAVERAEKAERGEQRAKAAVKKAATPAKPRKLGAPADGKALAGDRLRAAIEDADEVEIAFTDGEREIEGVAPIAVEGDAWADHRNGLLLKEPVDIEGAADTPSQQIRGYALMLDGKVAAYSARSTPLQLAPGQRVRLQDDIIF